MCDFDLMSTGNKYFGDIKGYITQKQTYKRWSDVKDEDEIPPYIAIQDVAQCQSM